MKCPLCDQPIHEDAECCPHCDLDGSHLQDLFAERPTQLRLLNDAAGILKVTERRSVERWIRRFNREFPFCYLTIHSVDLTDNQNVHSYGIWALNFPQYSDLPKTAHRGAGLCLVIDVHKKQVALNYGYQLEPYLSAEACFNALTAAHPYLLDHSYIEAIEMMRHGIRKLIRSKSRHARSILKKKNLLSRILS